MRWCSWVSSAFYFPRLSIFRGVAMARELLDGECRPNETDMCETSVYLPRLCIPQHESQVPIGAIWRKTSEHGNASTCIQQTRSSWIDSGLMFDVSRSCVVAFKRCHDRGAAFKTEMLSEEPEQAELAARLRTRLVILTVNFKWCNLITSIAFWPLSRMLVNSRAPSKYCNNI